MSFFVAAVVAVVVVVVCRRTKTLHREKASNDDELEGRFPLDV